MNFLNSMADVVLDRSPEVLVGALMAATALAVIMAAIYALGQRKLPGSSTLVGALVFGSSLLSMALAAGYFEHAAGRRVYGSGAVPPGFPAWPPAGAPRHFTMRPPGMSGAGWSSGFHVVIAADEDHNGRVTADELARLVRKADTDGDGSVESRDIDRLILGRFRPPSSQPGSPPPGGLERETGDGPRDGQHERGEADRNDATSAPTPDE